MKSIYNYVVPVYPAWTAVMQLVIVPLNIVLSLCLQWVWQVIMYSLPIEVMQVIPWFPSAWKRWTGFKFRSLGYLPVTTRLGNA